MVGPFAFLRPLPFARDAECKEQDEYELRSVDPEPFASFPFEYVFLVADCRIVRYTFIQNFRVQQNYRMTMGNH